MIAIGSVGRVVVAFATYGSEYDIQSMAMVAHLLRDDPLGLYTSLRPDALEATRWPYPPLFFPWIAVADVVARNTALPFHGLVSIPGIAADAAIAWLVQDHLARRGATERVRLGAVALVALGPSFAIISGFHGQIDSVAILPAVAAFWLWEARPQARRALVCGLLIGVGAAVKTAPGIFLFALLPRCRDRREAAILVAAAVAVPLLCISPWLVHDPGAVADTLQYAGIPRVGGLTLALQPSGAEFLTDPSLIFAPLNAPAEFVVDHRVAIDLGLAVVLGALLLRARPPVVAGAVLIALGIYCFATGFFVQYLVWGLPFMLMAGHLRAVAAIQAVVLVPAVLFYGSPWDSSATVVVYAVLMIALWLGFLGGFAVLARRALVQRAA